MKRKSKRPFIPSTFSQESLKRHIELRKKSGLKARLSVKKDRSRNNDRF